MKTEKPKLGRPVTGEAMTKAEKQRAYRERKNEREADLESMIQSMKKELAEKEKIITALLERIVYLKG